MSTAHEPPDGQPGSTSEGGQGAQDADAVSFRVSSSSAGRSLSSSQTRHGDQLQNYYGSKSQRGTEVAALFYSLIETAKLRGEDPGDYLLRAARAAIDNPDTVTLPQGHD